MSNATDEVDGIGQLLQMRLPKESHVKLESTFADCSRPGAMRLVAGGDDRRFVGENEKGEIFCIEIVSPIRKPIRDEPRRDEMIGALPADQFVEEHSATPVLA